MPYDKEKKRLYVDRSVTPNKGITPDEVAQCIKDFRKTRFGRDVGMLCASPNVNMWAKYKPFVRINKTEPYDISTEEEYFDANYGLDIPMKTTIAQLKLLYDGELNGWGRKIPSGFAYTEPFRLVDFDGYWHEAQCPFVRLSLPSAAVNKWNTSGFKIAIPTAETSEITEAIGMTEIKDIRDYYFTIQLRHTNPQGTGIYYRTLSAENTVAEMSGGYIEFSTYQLPKGDWELIPFLSPVRFTTADDGSDIPRTRNYIPIPKCYVGDMKISDTEYSVVYFKAYKNPYASANPIYVITYNFAVRNNTSDSHTFENAIVQIRYPGKGIDDTIDVNGGERQVVLPSFTVASGETLSVAEAVGNGMKWLSQQISQALYNNFAGQEILVRLDRGQQVYRLAIKSTSTGVPEYDDSTDYPDIEPTN